MILSTVLVAAVGAGGVLALGAGVALLNRGWQERQKRVLAEVAERLSGQVRPGGLLTGHTLVLERPGLGSARLFHGAGRGDGQDRIMRLEIPLPRRLPELRLLPVLPFLGLTPGLHGPRFRTGDEAFDERFELRGRDASSLRSLLDAELRRAVLALAPAGGRDIVELALLPPTGGGRTLLSIGRGGWIFDADELVAFVERSFAVASGLVHAWDLPWRVVERRFGLAFATDRTSGRRSLEGTVQGLPVRLWEAGQPGPPHTRLSLGVASLPGLLVQRAPARPDPAWKKLCVPTQNPVLDLALVACCDDPEALAALCADPELSACLLEAVHAHPGSILSEHRLLLVAPGLLHRGVEPFLEVGLRLAQAIRERLARLEDQA